MKKALVALALVIGATYGIAGAMAGSTGKQVVEKASHSRLAAAEAGI